MTLLVCGCDRDASHVGVCRLGQAEGLALQVMAERAGDGWTAAAQLRAIIGALVDADLTGPTAVLDWELVCGLLDDLWETGVIPPTDPPPVVVTVSTVGGVL